MTTHISAFLADEPPGPRRNSKNDRSVCLGPPAILSTILPCAPIDVQQGYILDHDRSTNFVPWITGRRYAAATYSCHQPHSRKHRRPGAGPCWCHLIRVRLPSTCRYASCRRYHQHPAEPAQGRSFAAETAFARSKSTTCGREEFRRRVVRARRLPRLIDEPIDAAGCIGVVAKCAGHWRERACRAADIFTLFRA